MYSFLPFRAAIGDRDAIHVHHITRTTGNMMVSTENATSLPWRSFQIDHEHGYNRIIMNGPINGRATDKFTTIGKNDPGCINKYVNGYGMGMHIKTLGSRYETANELYSCYGVSGTTEVDSPPCSGLAGECYIENSYFTMLEGTGGGRFERFYKRNLAKVVYGEDLTYSQGVKSIKSKDSVYISSVATDVLIRNSIKCSEPSLPSLPPIDKTGMGSFNAPNSIHCYADGNNNMYSQICSFVGSNGLVLLKSLAGLNFIQGNLFVIGTVFAANFRVAPIPFPLSPMVFEGPSPSVGIQSGYNLYPDSHKAIVEDIWDESKQTVYSPSGLL